ncbi:cyclic nucleotide-binding domain-containing protein [Bdellovibrionota bacterium FG-2]
METQKNSESAELLEHIRQVALFKVLSEKTHALEQLLKMMSSKQYLAGAAIIKEGEQGSEFFILIEGVASVIKSTIDGEEYKVALLRAQDHIFFGEGGLLDTETRSASVRAESNCQCLVLERAAFESFSKQHPHWAYPVLLQLARTIHRRLGKASNDLILVHHALVEEVRGGEKVED